jgi:hypothetical protein
MKSKKLTYALLIAVIGIWGFAIIQLFTSLNNTGITKDIEVRIENSFTSKNIDKVYELSLNYKDPFLANEDVSELKRKRTSQKKVIKEVLKEPEPIIDLSFIKYFGLIKNKHTGKFVSLITIHNNQYLLSETESAKEVLLLKNLNDSIKVQYLGKTFYIKK